MKPSKKTQKSAKKPTKPITKKPVKATKPSTSEVSTKAQTAAIVKMLKGIDNEAVALQKSHAQLHKKLESIQNTLTGAHKLVSALSNSSVKKPVVNTTASISGKPASHKNSISPPNGTSTVASESKGPIKNAIVQVLKSSTKAMKASEIYNTLTSSYGTWSRQSLYNALKDANKFHRSGDSADAVYVLNDGTSVNQTKVADGASTSITEQEADALIKKMEENSAPLTGII